MVGSIPTGSTSEGPAWWQATRFEPVGGVRAEGSTPWPSAHGQVTELVRYAPAKRNDAGSSPALASTEGEPGRRTGDAWKAFSARKGVGFEFSAFRSGRHPAG